MILSTSHLKFEARCLEHRATEASRGRGRPRSSFRNKHCLDVLSAFCGNRRPPHRQILRIVISDKSRAHLHSQVAGQRVKFSTLGR
jgi:hypothetical protein